MFNQLSLQLFNNRELIGLFIIYLLTFFLITLIFIFIPERKIKKEVRNKTIFRQSKAYPYITKKDIYIITLITAFFAVTIFDNLGSKIMPQTYWQPTNENQEVILKLEDPNFNDIYIIGGEGNNNENLSHYQIGFNNTKIYGSNDNSNYELLVTLEDYSYLKWYIYSGNYHYQYIKIQTNNINTTITEIGFKQNNNKNFNKVEVFQDIPDHKYSAQLLIDEQDLIPLNQTYLTNTYFDEIYHARNAVEIANGQYMYPSVHPLLGTSIMALAIKILGENPLAFRIMQAIFSTLMLPFIYLIAKRLFNTSYFAAIATILFATDFMHITTGRIGTLEPFSIFFIILMFYFMILYFYTTWNDTKLSKQFKYLLLSGIFMGMAIATKWTGCYGAIGLAIIFFTNIFVQFKDYKKAKKIINTEVIDLLEDDAKQKEANIKQARYIIDIFYPNLIKTILWCILCFIIIPIMIYFLSFTITSVWRDGYSISNVINHSIGMYNYHSKLEATHPFQSVWWQWILDIRPIWYYTKTVDDIYYTISCFNNPIINWASVIALLYMVYYLIRYKSRSAYIITIGYLTNLAPWLLVDRCVFSYHYYPCVIFVVLAVTFACKKLIMKNNKYQKLVNIFIFICIFAFIIYLPIICGFGTTKAYAQFLEIFNTWCF